MKQEKPWKITQNAGGCVRIGPAPGETIAVFGGYGVKRALSDARRAIGCVNACRGIPLTQLSKLAEAWRQKRTAKA